MASSRVKTRQDRETRTGSLRAKARLAPQETSRAGVLSRPLTARIRLPAQCRSPGYHRQLEASVFEHDMNIMQLPHLLQVPGIDVKVPDKLIVPAGDGLFAPLALPLYGLHMVISYPETEQHEDRAGNDAEHCQQPGHLRLG
jgi:hypothetical protein